jgi:plasmid stabilization system protein ParE
MSRRLTLDSDAEQDLDHLFDYLAARNPTAAACYVRELRERCALYAESAFMLGQEEPGVAQRLGLPHDRVRSFVYRSHRCFFVVTEDELRVLGFIDMRQDVDAILEERFPHEA